MPRYALYYAPAAASPLWRFGSAVLGYDAATGEDVALLAPGGEPDWRLITDDPRRYGFHATLKAPFTLADGCDEAGLRAAMAAFAAATAPVVLDGLAATLIGPFCALTPVGDTTALNRLAGAVVTAFEPFRAPLTETERGKRLKNPLTSRQIAQLDAFGYPYVHDDFRFHMTLTGPMHADIRDRVQEALAAAHAAAVPAGPVAIDQVVLYRQQDATSRFIIVGREMLRG